MSHNHEDSSVGKKLVIGLILNTGFTVFEFIIGFLSGSLALISDASHNLSDSLGLLIALSANKIGQREADQDHTYGHGRANILAALLNSIILIALAGYIFYAAYQRIVHPEPVIGKLVAIVAFIGILVNGSVALLFRSDRSDLNIRSAFLGMAFDTLASVGALIAGLIIIFTDKTIVDPLVSLLIGIMLLFSAWGVVKDALHILLEGVPEGMDTTAIEATIRSLVGVNSIDDLHVWSISSHYAALSCHVVADDNLPENGVELVKQIKQELRRKHGIEHATIEIELVECLPKN